MRLTTNPEFPHDIRETLEQSPLIVVSGQPLNIWRVDGKELFMDECEFVIELPLFVTLAVMSRIPVSGHLTASLAFVGTYPMISGFALGTQDEYRFGVKPELGFEIAPYPEP